MPLRFRVLQFFLTSSALDGSLSAIEINCGDGELASPLKPNLLLLATECSTKLLAWESWVDCPH